MFQHTVFYLIYFVNALAWCIYVSKGMCVPQHAWGKQRQLSGVSFFPLQKDQGWNSGYKVYSVSVFTL